MENKLKPCPFCGGKAEFEDFWDEDGDPFTFVTCQSCNAQAGDAITREEAREKWNRRVTKDKPAAHWRHEGGDEWVCDICGHVIHTAGSWEEPSAKYCEGCGSSMRKERR